LARKPNYDFEKRRKEQERKAKKDAKREDRLRRKREGVPEEGEESVPTDATDAGDATGDLDETAAPSGE